MRRRGSPGGRRRPPARGWGSGRECESMGLGGLDNYREVRVCLYFSERRSRVERPAEDKQHGSVMLYCMMFDCRSLRSGAREGTAAPPEAGVRTPGRCPCDPDS